MRPNEGKIDIPGLERTAVTDLGALAALLTTAPACRWPGTARNVSPERRIIRWMSVYAILTQTLRRASATGARFHKGNHENASDSKIFASHVWE